MPSTVTVSGGATTGSFTIQTSGVQSATNITITGSQGGTSVNATLTINPPVLSTLVVAPTSVSGGATSVGTVTLSGPAGPGGVGVSLSSSSPSATVQPQVTVPAGATYVTFIISTGTVGSAVTVTISAIHGGATVPATLTVNP
jgi:hypothetical protein